jgi:AmiR/NasT family two-component response regulator
MAEAFTLMRTYARDHHRLLSPLAQAIITKDPDITD